MGSVRKLASSLRERGRTLVAVTASVCLVGGGAVGVVAATAGTARADTVGPITFESGYSIGSVNGQDGWTSTGAYDQAIVNNSSFPGAPGSFGTKSLRISDAVTSGSFGDQTFSKSVTNAAGEPGADTAGFPTGTLQDHFNASFSFASTTPLAQQGGLHMSVSPDRGDGARMSYVRIEGSATGWNLFFDDYSDNAPFATSGDLNNGCGNEDGFNETQIATNLSPAVPHDIRFNMQLVPGASNDVVQVYVDGALAATGTSWEDYYRFCAESGGGDGGLLANETRIVRNLEFREGSPDGGVDLKPADLGKGFLIDNVNLATGNTPGTPTISEVFDGTGSSASPTSVGVAFTVPPNPGGAPITSETATCVGLNGGPNGTATGLGSPIFVGGLAAVGAYQCTVTATNMFGTSPASPPFLTFIGGTGECLDVPTAPGVLSTGPGNASATVSWAPATGTCIAGYVVTPYLGGVAQTSKLVPGKGTTTVVKGLTNGASYTFTVTAENGRAGGPPSAMTAPITAGAPAAISSLHVTKVAKGSLKVTFGVPTGNGAPITSYAAVCTSNNQGAPKGSSSRSGPLTVRGLTPGKTYTCSVSATNKRGTGPASHASAAVRA